MKPVQLPLGWLVLSLITISVLSNVLRSEALSQVALVAAGMLLAVLLMSGLLQGVIVTVRLSAFLTRMRENRVYDLLCLLPAGAIHTNWSVCVVYLHHTQTFRYVGSETTWIVRFLFSQVVVFASARPNPSAWEGPLLALTQVLILFLIFHIDDTQSLVLGCLLAILSSSHNRSVLDARTFSLLSYLLVQFIAYTSTFLLAFTGLRAIYGYLAITGIAAEITQLVVAFGVLFGVREAALRYLSTKVLHELDAPPADWPQFMLAK
jgi:hypothetical protein